MVLLAGRKEHGMTTLTCYGGVRGIGGNKLLLEDADIRLFFDFGIDFGLMGQFFNEYLRPSTPSA